MGLFWMFERSSRFLKNQDGQLRIKKDPRERDKMALQKTILARATCLAGRVSLQHLNAVLRRTGAPVFEMAPKPTVVTLAVCSGFAVSSRDQLLIL